MTDQSKSAGQQVRDAIRKGNADTKRDEALAALNSEGQTPKAHVRTDANRPKAKTPQVPNEHTTPLGLPKSETKTSKQPKPKALPKAKKPPVFGLHVGHVVAGPEGNKYAVDAFAFGTLDEAMAKAKSETAKYEGKGLRELIFAFPK